MRTPAPLLLTLALLAGCGAEDPGGAAELPATLEIASPVTAFRDLEAVETWSEQVAGELIEMADKLRRRDFEAARGWLTDDFAGHGWADLPPRLERELPLATRRVEHDVEAAPVVGPDDFVAGIAAHIAPWQWVESVQWKVKAAEFEPGRERWGKLRIKIQFLGSAEDGGPRSLVVWARGRAVSSDDAWRLDRLALESMTTLARSSYLFADVSTSAGVAHSGARFGTAENRSFAWNGAASADVNGDGVYDLFVPSSPRSFLYLAEGAHGFREAAQEAGLAAQAGGTGAVFFDFDNDGDQDLCVADTGWEEGDGEIGGNPLHLWRNDGAGAFEEVGAQLGFDALCDGYTLTVLDYDLDGWLDVFVCNYGRVAAEPNNSWIDATNGTPNLLLRNDGGRGFEDVTARAGLGGDQRWTYAAASADFDADGDPDLYVANDYGPNVLWRNRGDGTFEDVTEAFGVADLGNGMGCAWGDLDQDGRLDLYVANMSSTAGRRILARMAEEDGSVGLLQKMAAGNSILLNRGERFERLDPAAGGIDASWAWSVALGDLDLDGRLDVFCANGFITGDTPADT